MYRVLLGVSRVLLVTSFVLTLGGCSEDSEAEAVCGDAVCTEGETCGSCSEDCGACSEPTCGDSACNGAETCASCPGDCGTCPASCGNGKCDSNETCQSCPGDCGACPACGGNGEPCCSGSKCQAGYSCSGGICQSSTCGADGQGCCPGNKCSAGLVCQTGLCRDASIGKSCSGSPTCAGTSLYCAFNVTPDGSQDGKYSSSGACRKPCQHDSECGVGEGCCPLRNASVSVCIPDAFCSQLVGACKAQGMSCGDNTVCCSKSCGATFSECN